MAQPMQLMLKHSELINRPVFDQYSGDIIGQVTQIWIDLENHRVLGFSLCRGFWDDHIQTFPWRQVIAVEPHRIVIQAVPIRQNDLFYSLSLERLMTIDTRVNYEIWSYSGTRVGYVTDYCFESHSGWVNEYRCVSSRWQQLKNHRFHLSPDKVSDVGRGWLLVSDAVQHRVDLELAPKPTASLRSLASALK